MALFSYTIQIVLFFLLVQKEPKKTPEMDYIPISGWFPDLTLVLL